MPCRYIIDRKRRLVVSTAWGRVTFADMKTHQDQLASDPEFSPEFSQLVDARAVTTVSVSMSEAMAIVKRRFFSRTSRRAFVGSGLPMIPAHRLMQAYSQFTNRPERICLFHDRSAALKWLGSELSERDSEL